MTQMYSDPVLDSPQSKISSVRLCQGPSNTVAMFKISMSLKECREEGMKKVTNLLAIFPLESLHSFSLMTKEIPIWLLRSRNVIADYKVVNPLANSEVAKSVLKT